MLLLSLFFIHCYGSSNIVLLIADDQDLLLGGMTPMQKLQLLVGDQGVTFSNAMVATPLCCPSRTTILTGRYPHNGGAKNNEPENGCGNDAWQNGAERQSFAVYAKQAGYTTAYSGKYLNTYGVPGSYQGCDDHSTHRCGYVPPGWDQWLGMSNYYYNYRASHNGKVVYHGDNYQKDYSTNLIRNFTTDFIRNASASPHQKPFLVVAGFHAAHDPCTAAPQYEHTYGDALTVDRLPWFNDHGLNKHWLLNVSEPFQPLHSGGRRLWCDDKLIKRWRTLLSLDDAIEEIVNALQATDQLNNTYIFYVSDNGYNLCTYCRSDKRLPYDNNIRVPFLVRGPGIPQGVVLPDVVANIDLAPTILDIMGVSTPGFMDGTSILPLLLGQEGYSPREDLLVEYWGEYTAGCGGISGCNIKTTKEGPGIRIQDSKNNTYQCVRHFNFTDLDPETNNSMYCQFKDHLNFTEYYNLNTDPYQMNNTVSDLTFEAVVAFRQQVKALSLLTPVMRLTKQSFGDAFYSSTNNYLVVTVSGKGLGTPCPTGRVSFYVLDSNQTNTTSVKLGSAYLVNGVGSISILHQNSSGVVLDGEMIVQVGYSGDEVYQGNEISVLTTFYTFPPNGVFLIGTGNALVSENVTYYSNTTFGWGRRNGFAGTNLNFAGWTKLTSRSSPRPWDECRTTLPVMEKQPPSGFPYRYIGVMVISKIVKSQATTVNVGVVDTTESQVFGKGKLVALLC